ncbi:MAG: bifunctional folylpolyglutamate synthase/dihydrofolate synthase [Prevotellaceae bacterium]|jgi:dihydrofolate synthase/folylpolyglutamate synthase|nr:bifunctional folylpolyglutamate synthase/dihydrofolate synthase [Prevotellaceae bacterium]
MRFSTYEDITAYLFDRLPMYQQVGNVAYKASLSTPEVIDRCLGHPHRGFRSIHVAGTNGKGSVSHMLAAVLQESGYRVGLYTSPHLKDFRERIKINGACITEDAVMDFVNSYWEKLESEQASFFEMTTAMAFDYFARQKTDVAVVETGMGGRLDATNIIRPALSVITNIALDHTEHLGDSPALIAREKAGIIKPDTPVVVGECSANTAAVFTGVAQVQQSPLYFAEREAHVELVCACADGQSFRCFCRHSPATVREYTLDLLGEYQQTNLRTVLTAIDCLRYVVAPPFRIPTEAVRTALRHIVRLTGLQGRWQILATRPLTICDTGHNAHGLRYTFGQLTATPHRQLHIVFGVMADKDLACIIPLMPREARYYFTQAAIPRARAAPLLAAQCIAAGLHGEPFTNVNDALATARRYAGADDVIYIGGSSFVVAEAI